MQIQPHPSPLLIKERKHKKVFVGLSGGVDSSVATALLKQQGYNVVGVFIKIWDERWGNCAWPQERWDAMKVAIKLDIPFKTLDLSAEYKKEVVDYMVREYKLGRTPNPDVMCNARIKFGEFLKWSLKQGADYVATGHYTRLMREISNDKFQIPKKIQIPNSKFNTKYSLLAGVDETKDQSYFLWQLKQAQLKWCLFPIGDYKKSEVREMARKFDLPTAEKKDSQGICFVGKTGLKEFLKKYLKPKRGKVLRIQPASANGLRRGKGEVIGHHDGAFFLTLGQRHGFVITAKTPHDAPYYIIGKNVRENTITVAQKHENPPQASQAGRAGIKTLKPHRTEDCLRGRHKNIKTIIIHKVNWIGEEPKANKKYQARFRHLQKLKVCKVIKLKAGEYKIKFSELQESVAPGQSLVIYDNDICLGGGIIK